MKRSLALLFGIVAVACSAFGQGSRHDDIVFGPAGHPLAGATITVCTSTATGAPCSPLAQLYTDATLTVPAPNPLQSDGLGNYHFYAAPGRYQLQISGSSITGTITQNDVILPNDPSSPSFSTVSASGAINALTLSLGGNLAVGGNASITGSLSIAGGAVPSTAQTNAWSAAQTFTADAYFKSGTPVFDVKAFCASGSATQTTGTIAAASSSLTLAAAIDFAPCIAGSGQPGEGIYVYHAGAQSTMGMPAGLAVTPTGITGSTTYQYQVSAIDTKGGQSAATAAVTITNGNATLSATNYNLVCWNPPGSVSVAASSGAVENSAGNTATITTTANHNLSVGQIVTIGGVTNYKFNGTFQVASVVSSTVFTVANSFAAANASSGNGTVAGNTTNSYVIYGRTGSAPLPFLASFYDTTPSSSQICWEDTGSATWGNSSNQAPDWVVTSSAPSTATNDWLETTISAGTGTTSLTVAATATNTATAQIVKHSDTAAIQAATNAANTGIGGIVHFPLSGTYIFSAINFGASSNGGSVTWQIDGQLSPQQTILIPRGQVALVGNTASGQLGSFEHLPTSAINPGFINPIIQIDGVNANPVLVKNLAAYRYAGGDGIVIQNGANVITLDNIHIRTAGTVLKAGYGWNPGGFGLNIRNATFDGWGSVPAAQSNGIGWGVDLNFGQVRMQDSTLLGHGMHCGGCATNTFENILTENLGDPAFLTWDTSGPIGTGQTFNTFEHIEVADNTSGGGVNLILTTGNNNSPIHDIDVFDARGYTGSFASGTVGILGCNVIGGGLSGGELTGCNQSVFSSDGLLSGGSSSGGNSLGYSSGTTILSNIQLTLVPPAANGSALAVEALPSQTGDLFGAFNSSGTEIAGITAGGGAHFNQSVSANAFSTGGATSGQSCFGAAGCFFGNTTMLVSPESNGGASGLGLTALSGETTGDLLYLADPSETIQSYFDYVAAFHTAKQIQSTVATGTPPFAISSTTPVPNLTAQYAESTQLSGTTASIGGSALGAGTCTSGTVTVTNATSAMAAVASPSADPGTGFTWLAFVSASNTVTVRVCNVSTSSATPTAVTYNVRVVQ